VLFRSVKTILIYQPHGLRRCRPASNILLMLCLDSQQLSAGEKVGTRIDQDMTIRAQEDQVLVAIYLYIHSFAASWPGRAPRNDVALLSYDSRLRDRRLARLNKRELTPRTFVSGSRPKDLSGLGGDGHLSGHHLYR